MLRPVCECNFNCTAFLSTEHKMIFFVENLDILAFFPPWQIETLLFTLSPFKCSRLNTKSCPPKIDTAKFSISCYKSQVEFSHFYQQCDGGGGGGGGGGNHIDNYWSQGFSFHSFFSLSSLFALLFSGSSSPPSAALLTPSSLSFLGVSPNSITSFSTSSISSSSSRVNHLALLFSP